MSGYPSHLLPSKNDEILSKDDLIDRKVARWHDPTGEAGTIFEDDGTIDASLIFYRRFPGLSCNLKPPSDCKNLKINLLNTDLEEEWTEGESAPKVVESDYEIKEKREVFEFNYKDIVSSRLPYTIDKDTFHLTINIVHRPLVANYSHCEFELKPSHPNSADKLDKLSSSKPAYHQVLITALRRMMEKYSNKCN